MAFNVHEDPFIDNGQNLFAYRQMLVNNQGDITPGYEMSTLPHGNWKDSTAYMAERLSQQEQRAYDLSLWKYMQNTINEYNLPVNQMARYGDAGLNPNLIYSQQSEASPVSMRSSSPLHAQSHQSQEMSNVIQASEGVLKGLGQIFDLVERSRMTNSAVAQQKAETSLTQEQARSLFLQNKLKEWQYFGQNYFFEGNPGPHGNVNILTFDDGLFGEKYRNEVALSGKQLDVIDQRINNWKAEAARAGASEAYIQEQTEKMRAAYGWINTIENPFLRSLAMWFFENVSTPKVGFGFNKKF